MIPKTIHYCWFGRGEKPDLVNQCIASWKKYCGEYAIKEWNEDNFDVNISDYTRQAYDSKKWAFVSDYVRLYALVNEGGIYMDTDVEVLRTLDEFLRHKAFSGFESEEYAPTGIMACVGGYPLFRELLNDYEGRRFIKDDGALDLTTNVIWISNTLLKYGLKQNNEQQDIRGFVIYPKDYFCPKSHLTGEMQLSPNTATIHHFSGSWKSKSETIYNRLTKKYSGSGKMRRLLGKTLSFPFLVAFKVKNNGTQYYLKKFRNRGKCRRERR